ncbi:MAG: hypothetical protein KDA41_17220, partial [Planctomycetales bacterium]|nr:hypothetical protein [Planctomycetales bacterium]
MRRRQFLLLLSTLPPMALAAVLAGCCCRVPQGGSGGYTPTASPFIVAVSDDDFTRTVLENDKPVLVDFWAPWCGWCEVIDPGVVAVAEEFRDRIQVARLNVDA